MTTKLVNCTPHALTLRNPETGVETVLPPSGHVARVDNTPGVKLMPYHGHGYADCPVPVYGPATVGAVTGLPAPVEGTLYVVSALVLAACGYERADVVGPGTGPNDGAVRNEKGHVVAVTRLVRG
jgi:hypothetical protein